MSARVYSDEYESPLVIWAPPTTGNSLARVLSYQYGAQMEKAIFPSDQFTVEEAIDDGLVALRISRDLGNMGAFEHGMPVNRVLVTHFITRRLTLAEADGDAGVADDTVSIRPYSGAVAESARRRAYRRRRWRGRRTRPYMSTGRAVYGCTWSSQGTKVGPCGHRDGHIGILDQLDGHERSSFRFWSASSSTPTRMTSDAIRPSRKSGICVRWSASFLPGVLLQRIHDQIHLVCSTECSNRGASRPVREPTDHVQPRGTAATKGGFVWRPFAVILTWHRAKIMTCRH
mmetsp:Transcript_34832/g.69451  ORF Transcript_34832/g.69451 Transcript_34832/m.69451 type:complete len:287 (+) Transcript_34832:43-903(+)